MYVGVWAKQVEERAHSATAARWSTIWDGGGGRGHRQTLSGQIQLLLLLLLALLDELLLQDVVGRWLARGGLIASCGLLTSTWGCRKWVIRAGSLHV